jgi:D-glycero-D-manno-heptose 1,7-bisphosphate phosphatase
MGKHEISRCAVFLDRDGVLNRPVVREGRPYPPQRVDEFALYDGVADACTMLRDAGFLLIVVTNQPDVGRGTQSRAVVEAMHAKLRAALPALDGIEICFHAGSEFGESCDCRKPKAGMLLRAAAAHGIDLAKSYLVGDRWRDVDCAHAAGCRAVFIDHGYQEVLRERPDFTAANLSDAAGIILRDAAEQIELPASLGSG